jgi:hypothetical protein
MPEIWTDCVLRDTVFGHVRTFTCLKFGQTVLRDTVRVCAGVYMSEIWTNCFTGHCVQVYAGLKVPEVQTKCVLRDSIFE